MRDGKEIGIDGKKIKIAVRECGLLTVIIFKHFTSNVK